MTVYEVQGFSAFCNATPQSVFEETERVLKVLLQVLLSKITLPSNNILCVFVSSLTNPICLFLNPCLSHSESISALLEL